MKERADSNRVKGMSDVNKRTGKKSEIERGEIGKMKQMLKGFGGWSNGNLFRADKGIANTTQSFLFPPLFSIIIMDIIVLS